MRRRIRSEDDSHVAAWRTRVRLQQGRFQLAIRSDAKGAAAHSENRQSGESAGEGAAGLGHVADLWGVSCDRSLGRLMRTAPPRPGACTC